MFSTPPTQPHASNDAVPLTVLSGADVLTPQGILPSATLQLRGGRIESITPQASGECLLRNEGVQFIPLSNQFLLTPGLCDIQINGALGVDFGTSGIPAIQQLLSQLPRFGVTSVLATLITAPFMDMVSAINTLEELLHFRREGFSRLLGFHLEGPFLNAAKRGTHPQDAILTPETCEQLELLLAPHVKAMTLAPECDPSGRLLQTLVQRGILPLAGHTQADKETLAVAQRRGLQGVTHLFNAMEGFTHRHSGTALHVLNNAALKATFIADGHHVHPDMLQLMKQVKGTQNLILVSDAMSCAGLEEGFRMDFGGQRVQVQGGKAINEEGNLAGSVQLMDQQVRNLLDWNLASLQEIFAMGSSNPLSLIGEGHRLGALKAGYEADVVLWHQPTMQVIATWVGGRLLWSDPRLGRVAASLEQHQASGGQLNDAQATAMTQSLDGLMSLM